MRGPARASLTVGSYSSRVAGGEEEETRRRRGGAGAASAGTGEFLSPFSPLSFSNARRSCSTALRPRALPAPRKFPARGTIAFARSPAAAA